MGIYLNPYYWVDDHHLLWSEIRTVRELRCESRLGFVPGMTTYHATHVLWGPKKGNEDHKGCEKLYIIVLPTSIRPIWEFRPWHMCCLFILQTVNGVWWCLWWLGVGVEKKPLWLVALKPTQKKSIKLAENGWFKQNLRWLHSTHGLIYPLTEPSFPLKKPAYGCVLGPFRNRVTVFSCKGWIQRYTVGGSEIPHQVFIKPPHVHDMIFCISKLGVGVQNHPEYGYVWWPVLCPKILPGWSTQSRMIELDKRFSSPNG